MLHAPMTLLHRSVCVHMFALRMKAACCTVFDCFVWMPPGPWCPVRPHAMDGDRAACCGAPVELSHHGARRTAFCARATTREAVSINGFDAPPQPRGTYHSCQSGTCIISVYLPVGVAELVRTSHELLWSRDVCVALTLCAHAQARSTSSPMSSPRAPRVSCLSCHMPGRALPSP